MNFKKYGIGVKSLQIFKTLEGLNKRLNGLVTLNKHNNSFIRWNSNKLINKKLYDNVKNNVNFYKTIKSYRGLRHKNNYPVRGQRTHTNAKKKIFKSKNFW